MIDGLSKANQPYLDNLITSPNSRMRQAGKSSLSSASKSQTSCLGSCATILWTAVKVLFFPITLSYYFFSNLFSSATGNREQPIQATFGTYRAPYPIQARKGTHKTIIEEAEGLPIQLAAKASGNGEKVAFLADASREERGLIAQLQLHRLAEKGMNSVDQGRLVFLENFTCDPADIGGDASSSFKANLIIAKSTPYPKIDGKYIFRSCIIAGFNGKQVDHLRESLRGQLFAAHKHGMKVVILDHFGSHQGTPSSLIRGIYDQLLEEEFAGCFKKVIFVKREHDDAYRGSTTTAHGTGGNVVQLKDL